MNTTHTQTTPSSHLTKDKPKTRAAVTIHKTPEEVFSFFRNFKNLPLFMKDLADIHILSPTRSRWVVQLKSGLTVEWDATVTHEEPFRMISWRSDKESEVDTQGTVWFSKAPGKLGTEVSLSLSYAVPGGKVTELATKLMGEDPDTLTRTNLKRLKALLETGEIPTTQGQPSGREKNSEEIPAKPMIH